VQRRDDHAGPDLLAVVQHHAGRAAPFQQHAGHPGPGADGRALLPGGAADRISDRAHPALREAPVAEMTVTDVADGVVSHHIGGARLVGPGPGADHPVDGERAFDLR
jgi:hypothetical protein